MPLESLSFDSTFDPRKVLTGFGELAREEGWAIDERSDVLIAARTGVNLRTWGEKIEITAVELAGGGSHVQVVVHSWQPFDWGRRADLLLAIRRRLSGWPSPVR